MKAKLASPLSSKRFPGERALARSLTFSLTFTFTETALTSVTFIPNREWGIQLVGPDRFQEPLYEWLAGYANGQHKEIPFPLEWEGLPPFTLKVLKEMVKIPFGETRTYGELAEVCGGRDWARAVGGACNRNPFPLLIPCHRIVGANGSMGGFAYGSRVKEALLTFEEEALES